MRQRNHTHCRWPAPVENAAPERQAAVEIRRGILWTLCRLPAPGMPPRFAGLHGHRTKLVIVLRGCGARGRSGRYKAVEIRAFVTSGEQQANSCDRQIELSHVSWKNITIGSAHAPVNAAHECVF